MKTSILLCTAFILGISIAATPSTPPVGQYQLVATSVVRDLPSPHPVTLLYRINTATGEVERVKTPD